MNLEPLREHQIDLLQFVARLKAAKDLVLAAEIAALTGETCDPTVFVNYRSGKRGMEYSVFPVILGIVDHEKRVAILNNLVAEHGLRVVADTDTDTDERGLADRTLELGDHYGDLSRTVRAAMVDGEIDDTERAALIAATERIEHSAAELKALLTRTGPAPARSRSARKR